MQLLIKNLKPTNSMKTITTIILLAIYSLGIAQDKTKIDGVAAVVGESVILDSDIARMKQEFAMKKVDVSLLTDCMLLGKVMEDKLYVHQAIQDSLEVSDEEVRQKAKQQISYIKEQTGSLEEALKFYGMENEVQLQEELKTLLKDQMLASRMQQKIVGDIEITPEEVRQFFNAIPKDSLPEFDATVSIAKLVIQPKAPKEEVDKVIQKLKEIKAEVIAGADFKIKAILYSQDPGSANNGGFYTMNRKTPFVKEFKDVAFSLEEGEISEPFETDFGWHIIKIDKIKGQELELRHILLIPKVTDATLQEAKTKIEGLYEKITSGKVSFDAAAREFSDDKDSKHNGGLLIDPSTGDSEFEITQMNPALYKKIVGLKEGEVSKPEFSIDQTNKKQFEMYSVIKKTPAHKASFTKDYVKIKAFALQEKQGREVKKWMAETIEKTYVKVTDDYRDCKFESKWIKENN